MKKILFAVFCVCFLSSLIFCGDVRVSQLGQAWLVPDERADINVNPARVNYISTNMEIARIDTDMNGYFPLIGSLDTNLTPALGYVGKFGSFNAGFSYSRALHMHGFDPTFLEDNLKVVGGMVLNETISWGADIYMHQYTDSMMAGTPLFFEKGLSAGVNYIMESVTVGAQVSYSSVFSAIEHYRVSNNLTAEMKLQDGSQIRAINTLSYERESQAVDRNNIAPGYGRFYGNTSATNYTGASFISTIAGFKAYASLINNCVSGESSSYQGNSVNYYTQKFRGSSDMLTANIGLEAPLFAEWLLLRFSYTPMNLTYYFNSTKTESNVMPKPIENRSNFTEFIAFPHAINQIGLGIKLGKDIDMDLSFGSGQLYDYKLSSQTGVADNTIINASQFMAEFTTKY